MAKSLEEMAAERAQKKREQAAHQNGQADAAGAPQRAADEPLPEESRPLPKKTVRPIAVQATDIHRTPPHSAEAEQGVLGSMLISPKDVIAECVEKITEEYFYIPAHQVIYSTLVDLWNGGQAVDLITFTQILRDRNILETIGGASFITDLYTFVPTAANVNYYLEIVRDKYILRQLIAGSTESVRKAYEEQSEVNTLLDEAEQRILSIGENRFAAKIKSMKENVMVAVEQIQAAYDRQGGLSGLGTGFSEFDKMTGGLHPGEMVVIAGRPSMGKTAFAMNIAEHVALNEHKAVGVFSLEMTTDQLTQRMVCSRARINLSKLRDGFLTERDFPSLTAAASKLAEARMFIDDSSGLSILNLRAKARRMKSSFGVEMIIVDYLQLLHGESKKAKDNRQIEVSEISSGLKSLCKELGIPVIVVAQLNRQPEARQGGKPRLSDLRESGSIEQDADLVGLLVRPEVYEEDQEARAEMAGEAELIIAKQRNGPIGEVALTFLKEFTRFEDRARSHQDEEYT